MSGDPDRIDPEVAAMTALVRYLEPLDRGACARVLEWAKDRFVDEQLGLMDMDPTAITRFYEALAEAARQMGSIRPLDIVTAAAEIARIREGAATEASAP